MREETRTRFLEAVKVGIDFMVTELVPVVGRCCENTDSIQSLYILSALHVEVCIHEWVIVGKGKSCIRVP